LLLLSAVKLLLLSLQVLTILGKAIAAGLEIRQIGLALLESFLRSGQVGLAPFDGCLASLQIGPEFVQVLSLATKGSFLLAECVQPSGELLPGLIKACGLLEQLLVAALGLLVEFALLDLELLAEFGLASLELLSLAREVLRIAMMRVHLPGPSLQVRLPPVERGPPIVERQLAGLGRFLFLAEGCLLRLQGLLLRAQGLPLVFEATSFGGNVFHLRLDPSLLFEDVVLAGLALMHAGLQVLLGLFEMSGPLSQILLPAEEHGSLGILTVGAGAVLCLEGLALFLARLESRAKFLLTSIQFDLETFHGSALLLELALVGGELDLVLPEPPQEALVLATGVFRRELLVRIRFSHSRLPSCRQTNAGHGTPAGICPTIVPNAGCGNNKAALDPCPAGSASAKENTAVTATFWALRLAILLTLDTIRALVVLAAAASGPMEARCPRLLGSIKPGTLLH
jgi:hypothetical protein